MTNRLVVLSEGFGTQKVFEALIDDVLLVTNYRMPELTKGDIVLFEGGNDINPILYKEEPGSFNQEPDYARDKFEKDVFMQARKLGLPMMGICRGSQLLCAMSGGKLVQHVKHHGQSHKVTDYEGREFLVSSTHHQMMYPFTTDHKMVAWSTNRSPTYLGAFDQPMKAPTPGDPEVVWFPKTKCLAMQYHPEFMSYYSDGSENARKYFKTFILGE